MSPCLLISYPIVCDVCSEFIIRNYLKMNIYLAEQIHHSDIGFSTNNNKKHPSNF